MHQKIQLQRGSSQAVAAAQQHTSSRTPAAAHKHGSGRDPGEIQARSKTAHPRPKTMPSLDSGRKAVPATPCNEGTSSYTGNKNPTSSPSSSRYLGVICPSPQVFHGELYWQLEMTVLLPGLVDCLQDPLQNKKLIASAGILNPYELPVQRWNTFR